MGESAVLELSRVAPGLTERDLDDLSRLSLSDLAELMAFYVDAGKVPDRGTWERVGRVLQASAPYFQLGGAILGIVSGVWGIAK